MQTYSEKWTQLKQLKQINMYELLKSICEVNEFPFVYARRDYANLYDEVEKPNVPYIFLDPIVREDRSNDMGVTESVIYSGHFMLVMSSDIDEQSYNYRYQTYIKPLIAEAIGKIKDGIRCGAGVTFNQWRTTEVINLFDYNFDGLIVGYNISIND